MACRSLERVIREALRDSLVDENFVQSIVNAVSRNSRTGIIRWKRRGKGCFELNSPYGILHAYAYFRGFWTLSRDTVPLVHAQSMKQAVIRGLQGAKATALLHAADGFGSRTPFKDGLTWEQY
jgi:hypothetical protein